jgi:hypothetical protein
MNRYQREKVKRMKRLSKLGIGYSHQKALLRRFDFQQLDKMINNIETIQRSGIAEKFIKSFEKSMKMLLDGLLKVFKEKVQGWKAPGNNIETEYRHL